MGGNFILNINDHGFSVAGYDKDNAKTTALNAERSTDLFHAFSDLQEFMNALETPRNIILLVPAGKIVDAVLEDLKPFLTENDAVIDCGNSHFTDTQRRVTAMEGSHVHFMGMGISGGETGARYGASIMPGGDKEAHARIAPMLNAVCAKIDGEPCTAYMGNGAAGHYVKMVHNGIEYAMMQTLSECYHLMKVHARMTNAEIQQTFAAWNRGRLQSFLVEITAAIFNQPDDLAAGELVDSILDTAAQKGTGAWTSQDAANVASPIPVIDAAVSQRIISAMRSQRQIAAKRFPNPASEVVVNKEVFLPQLEAALYSSFVVCYAQGMQMLSNASEEYKFNINLTDVAAIWRGGCIIRAAMLVKIKASYEADADLKNIMLNDFFAEELNAAKESFKTVVSLAFSAGIPIPALSAALNYYLSYHAGWLPANLIQAQRDFFGAHTYQRNDREGTFHTNWNQTIH